jgi:hypothetical protein
MRIVFLSAVLFLGFFGHGQKPIKKKFRGLYQGEIPSYNVFNGENLWEISASVITIELSKSNITMKIGKLTYAGEYTWTLVNNEILISSKLEGLTIPEKITIDNKSKEMTRFGRSPQPNAQLTKAKKSKK